MARCLDVRAGRSGGFWNQDHRTGRRARCTVKAPAITLLSLFTASRIKRRIDAATKCIDLDQLRFPRMRIASTLLGNLLTEDQEFAKLALVVEIAREVWGE